MINFLITDYVHVFKVEREREKWRDREMERRKIEDGFLVLCEKKNDYTIHCYFEMLYYNLLLLFVKNAIWLFLSLNISECRWCELV